MRLYIELKDRTRTAWIPTGDSAWPANGIPSLFEAYQNGDDWAGGWKFLLTEDLSELGGENHLNPAEVRLVAISEIGSILAMGSR